MSDETRLLVEVLRRVPSESIWHISSDSWQGIKTVFGALLFGDSSGWQVKITDENRSDIFQKAEEEEVAEKIVHMDIESNNGETLFRSYDAKTTIIINAQFYSSLDPDSIPADLEIGLDHNLGV